MIELITPDSAAVAMDSLSTASTVVQTAADSVSAAIQNHLNEATLDSIFSAIREYTGQTASHTEKSFLWDQVCVLGLVSLAASVYTIRSIFTQERLTPDAYRALLYDLVRHLYRNKICTLAMWTKYNFYQKQNEKYYPSDEHYMKLQIPGSDIRPDQYSYHKTRWGEAHELELLFRNYNVEIEVALNHIKDDSVDEETKQRDFRTLYFKTGYLSKRIVDFIEPEKKGKWFKEEVPAEEEAFAKVKESFEKNIKANPDKSKYGEMFEEELKKLLDSEENRVDSFAAIFKANPENEKRFHEYLYLDAFIECGRNSMDEEKIHMIHKVNTK
jgi:uncharacterized protein YacL (UPF0231 family)